MTPWPWIALASGLLAIALLGQPQSEPNTLTGTPTVLALRGSIKP